MASLHNVARTLITLTRCILFVFGARENSDLKLASPITKLCSVFRELLEETFATVFRGLKDPDDDMARMICFWRVTGFFAACLNEIMTWSGKRDAAQEPMEETISCQSMSSTGQD